MIRLVRHIPARLRAMALGIGLLGPLAAAPVYASQATCVTPGSPLSMTSLASFLNSCFSALGTFNIGSSSPTVGPSGAPIAGMAWWNNSNNPWKLEYYDGAQWVGGVTLDATNHLFGAAFTNTVNVNPPSGTTTQGLAVSSTAPSSGSQAGTFNFNEIDATNPGYSNSGTTLDSFGLNPAINGLRVNLSSGGASGTTIPAALTAAARATGASPNLVGGLFTAYSNINSSGDAYWGGIGFCNVGAGGNISECQALDAESALASGGAIAYRVGLTASSLGPGQGTTIDTAFSIQQAGCPLLYSASPCNSNGVSPYASTAPYVNGLTLLMGPTGKAPLATAGHVIYADQGGYSLTDFVNMCPIVSSSPSCITFTGYLFNFTNFAMSGAGYAVFGSGAAFIPSAPIVLRAQVASGGQADLLSYTNTNSTSAFDGLQAQDSAGTNDAVFGVTENARTDTTFGFSNASVAKAVAFGSTTAAFLLGATTNIPLIFGTNNLERARILGDGCFDIGVTSDCGAAGILNLGTGLRIANAATSGHYLRGNGTNYVDGAIASGDLPAPFGATSLTANAFLTGNGASNLNAVALTGIVIGNGSSAPSATNVTGAVKDNGSGSLTQAACADLSNAAASCATDATNASNISSGSLSAARLSLSQITNSISSNVSLNNTSNFFDGPSVAQGSTGTWFASGTVSVFDTSASAAFVCKLWDGTTIIASGFGQSTSANNVVAIGLSGYLATPAGNIKISCKDTTSTNGGISASGGGSSANGSTVSAFRVN
jgi:hypothetical protein